MAGGRASRPDEMDAHPGLAPGSSVLRTDGSTTLPCARLKMGRPTGAAPAQRPSQGRMLAVTSRPPSKVILRPALPRHGPHYECGALLASATEELKSGAPARTRTSNLRLRRAACRLSYTSGANIPGRSRTCVASFGDSHSLC